MTWLINLLECYPNYFTEFYYWKKMNFMNSLFVVYNLTGKNYTEKKVILKQQASIYWNKY